MLSSTKLLAARRFLKTHMRRFGKPGQALFKAKAVLEFRGETEEEISGRVLVSAALFLPILTYNARFEWESVCTCRQEKVCEHSYALMMAVAAETEAVAPTEKTEGKSKLEKPPLSETVQLVEGRLGRKLTSVEDAAVEQIEKFHAQTRHLKLTAESSLAKIFEGMDAWGFQSYELWPTPPTSPWQAWLYAVHWSRGRKARIPECLRAITLDAEVDELVSSWEQEKAVAHWNEWLSRSQGPGETASANKIELRAVINREAVTLVYRPAPTAEFKPVKQAKAAEWARAAQAGRSEFDGSEAMLWREFLAVRPSSDLQVRRSDPAAVRLLNILLRTPALEPLVCTEDLQPFTRQEERFKWQMELVKGAYHFRLTRADGSAPPPVLFALDGHPSLYVAEREIFACDPFAGLSVDPAAAVAIPAAALETGNGVAFLERLGQPLPEPLAARTVRIRATAEYHCSLQMGHGGELLVVKLSSQVRKRREEWTSDRGWILKLESHEPTNLIPIIDRSTQPAAVAHLASLGVTWSDVVQGWTKPVNSKFPDQWIAWRSALPPGAKIHSTSLLDSLDDGPVAGRLELEVDDVGIDWFDLRLKLTLSDTEYTDEEIQALLEARGGYVRLGDKGWRRLDYQLTSEDEERLAEMGLNPRDLSGEKQRFHALQLAGKVAQKLLAPQTAELVRKRADEIRMRVTPEISGAVKANLRPYQREGFHFLAYLSANRFGGILADDMGLGKTLQTLAWIAWLREQPDEERAPILVVSPKSVVDTWRSETARFYPEARVRVFRAADEVSLADAVQEADIIVVNYAQIRLSAAAFTEVKWMAVILDEAQYIKNPGSQVTQAACNLSATHRLALTGTPIENRLLDLWSIMHFAMPGALGKRADFARNFDERKDPLARRRLGARVRPFVLRRTKGEVASDLPERIEEDLFCEMEGEQSALYRAELKRARRALLKIQSKEDLDKDRFNILTSLMRLRQICCHPALVQKDTPAAESAKLAALLDLLEPLMEEGHKVLIFSQFVEMLELIEAEISERKWPVYKLTGATENRGSLVEKFQTSEGCGVFLISLRAGGAGLTLTAASYVVLFDPWWNPAVENQAIDRTHRIGQVNRVIAYRLLVAQSIEEKIRLLQKKKSALAADILGEESFAKALTLEDFQFLVDGQGPGN